MKGEILFLVHRIPFPPDRGDKIRSHHLLRRLAEIAPVHVATLADDDADMAHEAELAGIAASHMLVRRSKPLALAGLQALAGGAPVSLTAFRHPALKRYVAHTLATRPIAAIYVFSGQMGQYVPEDFAGRVIADFVDVDSAKFEAYAAAKKGVRGWIDAREGKLLRRVEIALAQRADMSLLISRAEADLFRSRLPDGARDRITVRALGNGIDSSGFDPSQVEPESRMLACSGPRLIFTGQMDYAPNIEAARRAIDHILPMVRFAHPDASFHVVGRNPPRELLERHGVDGAFVWGGVPDMRRWLKAADLAVVPLLIGRGVQNKVLEAMAMRLPVVLSPEAATGIDAVAGRDFQIAASDEDMAAAIDALVRDRDRAGRMGACGRSFVVERLSWSAALASLPEILGAAHDPRRHAA